MKKIIIPGLVLALFALVGNFLVIYTEQLTHEQIETNKRQALLNKLYQLIDKTQFNNDLIKDKITVNTPLLSHQEPVSIYRAYLNNKPSAVILQAIANDGYSGRIYLLVGINIDGKLSGVRVTDHKETPGLGDNIDSNKSDWILSFNGKSLNNPTAKQWKVKKDGGVFDQFSGATISPRAIVKAVHKALQYYQQNKTALFERELNE